jgi:NADH:ubiquinone reductase (H+-translocating)
MSTQQIVVIGGGFAGVKAAKTLRSLLDRENHEIVVFNRENHMVFHPLLAELAGAVVQPKDVGAPIRELLPNVQCRRQPVLSLELSKNQLVYEADGGKRSVMHFDHLVLACGNEVNLAAVPGMADHAFPMKSIGDAVFLQGHIVDQLERADVCDSPERKRWHLTFVVIGGGFSGVEVAGQLNDLIRGSRKFYRNISLADMSVTLVHSGDQILPEVSKSMRDFAARKMTEAGIRILLNSRVAVCASEGVRLTNGDFISGGTVVCTIGTTPHPLIQHLDVPKERGRLLTEPDMSLPGYPNIWAIGDCAAVINALDGQLSPPTAQFAERQAKQVSGNIAARIKGKETRPFSHKSLGSLCSIGGRNAVAEMMGLHISGFPAWFAWRGIYLMKLPSFPQQIKIGIEWMLDLILPRPLAHLRDDRTNRVYRSFVPAGDFVFREGDPATDFYMIESGELEILQPTSGHDRDGKYEPDGKHEPDEKYEPVAILGVGDFFGERALIDDRPHQRACRARSDVELVVIGSKLFTEISSSLAPLKQALVSASKRRTAIWQQLPELREILDAVPLETHIEHIEVEPMRTSQSLSEAVRQMNENKLEVIFVVDDRALIGVLTRTDLLRAVEVAAALPPGKRLGLQVKDIMVHEPIAVAVTDSTSFAVATMREHGLTKVPVVDSQTSRTLKGYVRIENILSSVLTHVEKREPVSDALPVSEGRS